MQFVIKGPFKENIFNIMRDAGYHFQDFQGRTEEQENFIFTRPPKGFPRFHLFIEPTDGSMVFKLHLDQKRPIYKGVSAHAGEYDSDVVEQEAERIKQILSKQK